MSYKLRFVQTFDKSGSKAFLDLEQKFIQLERTQQIKTGRRFLPVMGRMPTNTLIWEAEFNSMESALSTLKEIEENADHDALLDEQIIYMKDMYIEIYKELEIIN